MLKWQPKLMTEKNPFYLFGCLVELLSTVLIDCLTCGSRSVLNEHLEEFVDGGGNQESRITRLDIFDVRWKSRYLLHEQGEDVSDGWWFYSVCVTDSKGSVGTKMSFPMLTVKKELCKVTLKPQLQTSVGRAQMNRWAPL